MESEINKEISECQFCPYLDYSFNVKKELGFGKHHRILFVGLSPAVSSNRSQGNSRFDKYFSELLGEIGITKDDYYFTNLCKTSIPKNKVLSNDEIAHCMSHVRKEIIEVKPQIIVLLGYQVRKAFGVHYPEQTVHRFFKNDTTSLRIACFSIAHPGVLHYEPGKKEKFLKAMSKGLRTYNRPLI